MANFLTRSRTRSSSSSSRTRTTRRTKKKLSDSENSTMGQCKKHPKHRQSPGVCSLCLNEKLSKLSLDYYDYTSSSRDPETVSSCSSSVSSSSGSSYHSSVSSCLSPLHHRYSVIVSKKKDGKRQGFLSRLLLG
ncbi:PREDICTED: uncharacterized protein LOC104809723 [Tarenaya hassleriana]|uniref:uncharacterized protein LOC104809723 n=1 Tax=Tarenaya hassleriana TaxID=28532 RepID=UPI00053C4677|nr:PREDICTED: uncharacterized protein LOC104809723 [Tarenaya hassleriana]